MKRAFLFVIGLLAAYPALAAGGPANNTTTVNVDCAKRQTIADALARNGSNLEIVLSGICNEVVRVTRDNVTIRGTGGAVLNGTIDVFGASNVTIENLTIRNGADSCIFIRHNAGAIVRNATIEDCGLRGILLEASAATIIDTTLRRLGTVGVLNRNSRVEFLGNIHVSDAVVACVSATDDAVFYLNDDDIHMVLERSLLGMVSQLGSEVTLANGTVIARNNQLAGFLAASQGVFVHGAAILEARDNELFGLYADELSSWSPFLGFGATLNIIGNGLHGVFVERGSAVELTGTTVISGNGGNGINVDGGILRVNGTNVDDVVLTFGTRAELGSGNTIGSIACDGTVLIRGASCAPAPLQAAAAASRAGKPAVDPRALIAKVRAALSKM
jgi:hypothetical protein